MEKKYHPIVTFKSLIEEFLHRYSIYAAKEQNHHFGLFAIASAKTITATRQANGFVGRMDSLSIHKFIAIPSERIRCACGTL